MAGIHEECGLFGIYSPSVRELAPVVYAGLYALQHRGQDSCGIAVSGEGGITLRKDLGLTGEVFTPETLSKLGRGRIAVGHVRYGASNKNDRENAQPILTKHPACTLAACHNGSLVNGDELRRVLENDNAIFHTASDAEIISYIITRHCAKGKTKEEAVLRATDSLEGAFSLILLFSDRLIAVRDKRGFRPLCYGITQAGEYIVASESCALDQVGAKFIRDIKPGEVVIFGETGVKSLFSEKRAMSSPCVFEYIYFARPDSIIDGYGVQQARIKAGELLAAEHPCDADVVIGVPDSGIDAAVGFSKAAKIPYGIGFIKNKYTGRAFIEPETKLREQIIKIKLNPVAETVRGKRVVMIDDSIIRGTTSARIINLLRESGAREIHVRITSPPFIYPCFYGTDIDSRENLIANNHSIDELCQIIGADSLGFLSVKSLPLLFGSQKTICSACFDGDYPTKTPVLK